MMNLNKTMTEIRYSKTGKNNINKRYFNIQFFKFTDKS